MTSNKKGWRGYNFSRLIEGSMIPQRVQNLVIRTYCQSEGLHFLLSATEYSMESSYMMLYTIYEELDAIEGIVFYSVHMLPKNTSERIAFYKKILAKGCGIRFALEELSLLKEEHIGPIEELMLCKEMMTTIEPNKMAFESTAPVSLKKYRVFNDEVSYSDEAIPKVNWQEIQYLKEKAKDNPRKRMRLCVHKGTDDLLHEMFIIHEKGTYVRPHKHDGKAESMYIIEGQADIIIFDDTGEINEVIEMGPPESGRNFFYRIQKPLFHSLLVKSQVLVFHETTSGPFLRDQTVFPSWGPENEDISGQKQFIEILEKQIAQFLKDK